MQKRFKLQPISILLFVSALTLAGCSHESGSSLPSKQSTIVLKISQGDHIEVFPKIALLAGGFLGEFFRESPSS